MPGQVRTSALFDQFEREVVPTLSLGARRSYKDSLKPLRTYFRDERDNPMVADLETGDAEGELGRSPDRSDSLMMAVSQYAARRGRQRGPVGW